MSASALPSGDEKYDGGFSRSGSCVPSPGGFIAPSGQESLPAGSRLNITWSGGRVTTTKKRTVIFDMILKNSSWETKIFSSKAYVFESNRADRDGVWTNYGLCNDTAIYQLWTVPTDYWSDTKFTLVAKNLTTDAEDTTYDSEAFAILQPQETSTLPSAGPTSTSNASSTLSLSSTATAPATPDADPGLSVGAKAGIGVGVAVVALAILVLAFLLWRRRNKQRSQKEQLDATAGSNDGYQKPELDGQAVKKPIIEAGGEEIAEADPDNVLTHSNSSAFIPRAPVELPAERFNRDL